MVTNQNCYTSKLMRHNEVRVYLGIKSDTILEFDNLNDDEETKEPLASNQNRSLIVLF